MNWIDNLALGGLLMFGGATGICCLAWFRADRRNQAAIATTRQRESLRTDRASAQRSEIELTMLPDSLEHAWRLFTAHGGAFNDVTMHVPAAAVPAALTIGHILDWTGHQNQARPIFEHLRTHAGEELNALQRIALELHLRTATNSATSDRAARANHPVHHEPCLRALRQLGGSSSPATHRPEPTP